MENYLISILAVIISLLIILLIMKFLKFLWRKVIYKVILFFRPELRDIYNLLKWVTKKIQPNKQNENEKESL